MPGVEAEGFLKGILKGNEGVEYTIPMDKRGGPEKNVTVACSRAFPGLREVQGTAVLWSIATLNRDQGAFVEA